MARPGRSPAPGSADRLGQQLVGPLRGPLVGEIEGDVGGNDADQRHLRYVQPLGHQARANQHVQPAIGERVEHALDGALVLDHVSIEAADTQAAETPP